MIRFLPTALAFFALLAAPASARQVAAQPLWGINISGGEFRGVESGALIPKPAELRAYYAAGFRLFRIPFKAAQLDIPAARARLVALAEACVAIGAPCIFDRHEYKWPPVAQQVAFWTRFARAMPRSHLIHLDLMNEPKRFNDPVLTNDWEQWARDSKVIVAGLRGAGVTNQIWLEWPQFSAAFRFGGRRGRDGPCGNARCALAAIGGIADPLNRTGLQAHRYFDKDGSGANDYCASFTSIARFAAAAREFRMPLLLGETAFGSNRGMRASCRAVGAKVIAELKAGGFYGVTWWGGGRAWNPKYLFYTPPDPTLPYVRMIQGR